MNLLRNIALFALLAVPALAASFPPETVLHEQKLLLNGQATRTVWGFGVYEVGLYLAEPSRDAVHIMREDRGPKRVRILMLRHVSQSRFTNTVQESIEKNFSAGERAGFAAELEKFLGCFNSGADLNAGSVVTIDYEPGRGMIVGVDGNQMAEMPGHEFYHAILRLWIGTPLQPSIKEGLLSGSAG